jgi:hypothetical protein
VLLRCPTRQAKHRTPRLRVKPSPCWFGLSVTRQRYFSLRTNQPPATGQQYFSLRTNQHQPSVTSQTNRPRTRLRLKEFSGDDHLVRLAAGEEGARTLRRGGQGSRRGGVRSTGADIPTANAATDGRRGALLKQGSQNRWERVRLVPGETGLAQYMNLSGSHPKPCLIFLTLSEPVGLTGLPADFFLTVGTGLPHAARRQPIRISAAPPHAATHSALHTANSNSCALN